MVPPWLEQTLGALLALFIFVDVFLTVLYARIGAGILSHRIARWIWLLFKHVTTRFSRSPGGPLSFCGPAILVAMVGVWALGLAVAMGLIIHPRLGTSVLATNGPTATDFISMATDPDLAVATRNNALATTVALLLGLVGSVLGGWMASGEPMTFTHHRTRDRLSQERVTASPRDLREGRL